LFGALRAGASGFLLKDTEPAELLAAVHVVAELYVRDRAQLVVLAYESGVIVPGAGAPG